MSKNLEQLQEELEKSTYGGSAEDGKTERRKKKKKPSMRISGKSVFELREIIRKKACPERSRGAKVTEKRK